MCGIICVFSTCAQNSCSDIKDVISKQNQALLNNRGPDKVESKTISKDGLIFVGCVLWQQGFELTPQPVVSNKFILLFNGDIFNAKKDNHISDTSWLIQQLDKCEDEDSIINLFRNIKGPFSVILYDLVNQELYFARDSLGRNSLLIEKDDEVYRISSVSCISGSEKITVELPPLGIYKLNINKVNEIKLYPWKLMSDENLTTLKTLIGQCALSLTEINNPIQLKWLLVEENLQSYDFFHIMDDINESDLFSALLQHKNIKETVRQLTRLIEESVRDRVTNTPDYCTECMGSCLNKTTNIICKHSKIGILFSGGIDCTILAAIAHKFVNIKDSIDLINVAFQNSKENMQPSWNVPDRLSAIESHKELQKLFPSRIWNLVEVNVTREELNVILKSHIRHLIYPLKTVLDESLGCAFWFAARGKGLLNGIPYNSNCRVILIGSGADELFGGYTRHRNAYLRCKGDHLDKIEALRKELNFDWERMPSRNLGRDDRVIGDNGKTARAPFIEEGIVSFVRSLSPGQKCYFNLTGMIGDKLLLRLCGYQLGLSLACTFKKRAIQFGSRIANKKQNAKDLADNLVV